MFEPQVRWLEAAAAQDHPDGLYNMAVMHAYGHGGAPQNNDLARQYFERAAALDFAPAKNGLAMLLSRICKKLSNYLTKAPLWEIRTAITTKAFCCGKG